MSLFSRSQQNFSIVINSPHHISLLPYFLHRVKYKSAQLPIKLSKKFLSLKGFSDEYFKKKFL